jgi:hypothetical protein
MKSKNVCSPKQWQKQREKTIYLQQIDSVKDQYTKYEEFRNIMKKKMNSPMLGRGVKS